MIRASYPQQKKNALLMLENTAAFSIRDKIDTCPYFEVKLKLRDDKPFFVRPYNIREDQKPIIQKEMDRLEKIRNYSQRFNGIQFASPLSKMQTAKFVQSSHRLQSTK